MTTDHHRRFALAPVVPRDPRQPHRAATPLELLFDLVFVVAVSFSSAALHELEAEGRVVEAVTGYLAVFFAIWWAWMNVTWFATSFDTDDWLYRIATIVQMAGALIVAAGAAPAILDGDFAAVVLGYVVMRLVTVTQWLRVAHSVPDYRTTALRYAAGITVVQVLWILRLAVVPSGSSLWTAAPLILLELAVPAFAERAKATPWHPDHVTERFGSFTLIVLGESILASATAIVTGRAETDDHARLWLIAAASLVTVAAMWWIYFARDMSSRITRGLAHAMTFGYVHFAIFAAAGAFSAGVEVAVAATVHEVELGDVGVRATFAVPVALFFLGAWWLALRPSLAPARSAAVLVLCAAMVAGTASSWSIVVTAAAAAAAVAVVEAGQAPKPA